MPPRESEIFREDLDRQSTLVSRLFAALLVIQWLAAIVTALVVSPYTWIGARGQIHQHVWAAALLGGVLAGFPAVMALRRPSHALTRHVVAVAQVLFSTLLIHLTGGRIETHFHVFASLAFLAFYRDWTVLVTATAVVAADHWWRGVFWPQSVFGAASAAPWRWLEHAGWVLAEDTVLVASCMTSTREMRRTAGARASLERSRGEVEEQVRARTTELSKVAADLVISESALRSAKNEAEDASRAKSEFLANMSHEIRTPMTAILGFADLLNDPSQRPEDRAECVAVVRRNGQHLLEIINDILDLSRIEAGKLVVESIPTCPVRAIEEVASLMQGRARDKGLYLRVEMSYPLPRFLSDPLRMRQIILNLVGNAIKFTQSGGVIIRFASEPAEAGDQSVRFEIVDTGIGLSPDQAARLFKDFAQADASTTRRFGGSGLGLSISRRLARMLGGDIELSSTPGRGTTATFRLRVHPTEILPHPADQPAESRRAESDVRIPARILLAEDGPDNQRLLGHHLRRAGADLTIVENGRQAVESVLAPGREPYALILMDMQMPEMDGYTAASLLRQKGCRIPIIALTAHAMSGDRERCIRSGCDDYLSKPVDRRDLLNLCAKWLADRPAAAA